MSTLPNPTIFLPGILGSELRDAYEVEPARVFSARTMMPLMDRLGDDYERIALHPDNPRYERIEPARVQEDQVVGMIYREFLLELRHSLSKDPAEPVPVYPFPYDWRQPLVDTEERLDAFIDEVIERTALMRHYAASPWKKTRRVNLVGHSMGGLIISGLLARKPERARRVGMVATLGTPYRGAIEAVAKLCMGTSTLGADGSSSREREAARLTPALYHLLPTYPQAVRGGPCDLFDPRCWQTGVLATLQRYLNAHSVRFDGNASLDDARSLLASLLRPAAEHRARIEQDGIPGGLPRQRWLAIVGIDAETRNHVAFRHEEGHPRFDFPEPDPAGGDGTVPLAGALPAFLPARHLVAVKRSDFSFGEIGQRLFSSGIGLHAALPSMNLVQRLVVSLFQGRREGLPGGRPFPGVAPKDWAPPHTLDLTD